MAYPLRFHVPDPLDGLTLRVNHERPPAPPGDDGSVLGGEGIVRQPLNVPVSHLCRPHHKLTEIKVRATRDLQLTDLKI